jgi:hypothetical protein
MSSIRAKPLLLNLLRPEINTIQDIAGRLKISYGSARKVIGGECFGKVVAKEILKTFPEPTYNAQKLIDFEYEPRFRSSGWRVDPNYRPQEDPTQSGKRHMRRKPVYPKRQRAGKSQAAKRRKSVRRA